MAIEFARVSVHSRASGHSAVRGAAYRAGETLHDERTDETARFGHRVDEVGHSEVLLPAGADPALADRQALWNAVEAREDRSTRRATAQVAKDHVIALPREVGPDHHRRMAREFATEMFVAKGVPVDLSVHYHSADNPHAHLYTPTRYLEGGEFGRKARELNGRFAKGIKFADAAGLKEAWAEFQNRYFQREGIDLVVVPSAAGLETQRHLGAAAGLERQGIETDLAATNRAVRAANLARVAANPGLILDAITERKAVFTRRDIGRELHRLVDEPEAFQALLARIERHERVVALAQVARGGDTDKLTTREMVAVEAGLVRRAARLAGAGTHGVAADPVTAVLSGRDQLSAEQVAAVRHVTAAGRIAVVAGLAGAGKSTMLAAAKTAWEAAGYRVRGAALAGIAADGLARASGMEARTLHAWELAWRGDREALGPTDVLVIDEAGMVGSRQLGRVLEAVDRAGAKVVLVGDAEQLQAIEAGAPFRAIAERIGGVEIGTVRRQREGWQREASAALARGAVAEALTAYAQRGHVHMATTREAAKAALCAAYLKAPAVSSRIVLAHSNRDVADLNGRIRAARLAVGEVDAGRVYRTERGERAFGTGDRVLFLRNDRGLGVKNGMIGTVASAGPTLSVRLDDGTAVTVDPARYAALDHGYAATIHKGQGITVERSWVLASGGMDRHLAYVALTRHRDRVDVHAAQEEFASVRVLHRRLGRENRNESTLDYAERYGVETGLAEFKELRAWALAQRARVTALWWRLRAAVGRLAPEVVMAAAAVPPSHQAAGPVSGRDGMVTAGDAETSRAAVSDAAAGGIPPHVSVDGRDSLGRGLDPESVAAAARSAAPVVLGWRELRQFAEISYRDPAAAQATIVQWVERHGYRRAAELVRQAPAAVGALRGGEGLFAGSRAKTERQAALGAARGLADTLDRLEGQTAAARAAYIDAVERQRRTDAIAVPALSAAAQAHLRHLRDAEASGPDAVARAYGALQQDAGVVAELQAYDRALRARLGEEGYRQLMRSGAGAQAGVEPTRLAAAAQTVQTLQQAQRANEQVQKASQRLQPRQSL